MTMTLGQLIDHCQQSYNSATGDDFFPTAWYITTIWRAESELAIQGWVIEKTYSATSVSGTRSYAWPTNALAIREVRYDYEKLDQVTLKDDPKTDLTDPSGTPTAWAAWENIIYLFPTPSESDKVIQVRSYMAPDQLTAMSDPLNVPDEYQIQMVDFVLSQMAIKDQNMSLASFYAQKWEQTVERARRQRKMRMQADKNHGVRDVYFNSDGTGGVFANGWRYW